MNAIIKRKIGRGVKEAVRRRRLSAAMKASWQRRRNGTQPSEKRSEQDELIRLIGLLQKLIPHEKLIDQLTALAHKEIDTWTL